MRSRRRETASKTLTVPATLTRIPSGGLARTNGTWRAARWTTRGISCSSSARASASRSVMSPRTSVMRSTSSPSTRRSRAVSSPRSKPTTSAPSSSAARAVQAPRQARTPVTRKRSATSAERSVLVDRHRLGEELERGAPLLVRAEAGALDSAKRDVDVCARRLGVDVEDPGLQLLGETLHRVEVTREDRRREAEGHGVRALERLVERGEAVERRHGAEDLLAREERVVGDLLEDGRRDEVALVVGAVAARGDDSSLGAAALDRCQHVVEGGLGDDRADLRRGVRRVADLPSRHAGEQSLAERVVDGLLDEDAPGRGALLPRRPERAGVGGFDRPVELRVG